MNGPIAYLRVALFQMLVLLAVSAGDAIAVQIEPNPNPLTNTITIVPSTPVENLIPFTNLGIINIETAASFHNGSRLDNSGGIFSAGTITNSDVFINNRVFTLLEGSQFNNLASGHYTSDQAGSGIQIQGTFVNEGAVTPSLGGISVSDSGQYIQRQSVGSSVTPTTMTPDAPFRNAGRVHIAAGDFIIDPISVRGASATYDQSSTGTTQIDARFQNIGGQVVNAGAITIGATGEYRQQSPIPDFPFLAGTTTNTGTFTNIGTTNIQTGVFENKGGFLNPGIVHIGEGATFTNTSGVYHPFPGGTTKIDGNFINNFAVQNGGAITVTTTGSFSQVAGLSPIGTGTGQGGTFTNAGRVYIGEGTEFRSGVLADRPTSSGQYVQLASGTTRIDGSFDTRGYVTNEGAITVGATGQYLQSRGDSTGLPAASTNNIGTFTNAGLGRIGEGTSFNNFSNQGLPVAQYVQQASGTTQIDGTFQNAGARVENAGSMTVGSTATYVQAFNKFVPVVSTTVNTGTFTNAGSTLINGGTFTNQGNVVNSGTLQVGVVGPGAFINHGGVVNSGTFEVAALGQISGTGSYVQNAAAAQTIVNGTFAHNISFQAGTLTGTGTIQGTVQNSGGLLLPGNNGLGTLTIKGQYAQGFGGTFGVNLAGLSSFGLLAVQGTGAAVTLGGSLQVGLLNGFSPSLGNTFGILTCTGCTISGGLRSLLLPTLASGLDWSVGFVNGLGMLQLAVVSAATASAPEPDMLLLVGAGFVGLVGWRRRQRRSMIPSSHESGTILVLSQAGARRWGKPLRSLPMRSAATDWGGARDQRGDHSVGHRRQDCRVPQVLHRNLTRIHPGCGQIAERWRILIMKKLRYQVGAVLPLFLFLALFPGGTAFGVPCGQSGQITPMVNLPGFPEVIISNQNVCNGAEYFNASQFTITEQGKFVNSGQMINNGSGTFNGGISNSGTFVNETMLTNSGRLRNESGGTFINAGTITNQGNLVNDGTLNNTGRITTDGGRLFNNGFINNGGQLTLSTQSSSSVLLSTNDGMLVNGGNVDIGKNTILLGNGSYLQVFTDLSTPGKDREIATIVNGITALKTVEILSGSLSGTGTLNGLVTNTGGTVQPGSDRPGTLSVFGGYTQGFNGRLDLKIGGLRAGSQYDVLKVAGPISLRGGLFVSLIDGFAPQVGNRFNLITGSQIDVGINQISLPPLLAGIGWSTSFAGGVFALTVGEVALPGSGAPEPSTLLLTGSGLAWLMRRQWRKRQILKVAM